MHLRRPASRRRQSGNLGGTLVSYVSKTRERDGLLGGVCWYQPIDGPLKSRRAFDTYWRSSHGPWRVPLGGITTQDVVSYSPGLMAFSIPVRYCECFTHSYILAIIRCPRLSSSWRRCAAALWAVHAMVQSESRNASRVGLGLGGNTYCSTAPINNLYKCLPLCETIFISTSFTILLPVCTMSTADIKYPPAAHTYHDELAAKPAVTSSQPRANATMAVGSNNDQARAGKAERIRGGCVPCPDGSVCWIIPIPCCCC
ncbi:hypothetical protein V8E52_009155 [Russula decolorans]